MSKRPHITVLGGGPAGLAVGYYAQKKGLPFRIYEANDRVGGNSITLKHGDFLFDSGAHRFHDKYPEVTKEIKKLLGEDLEKINIPSQIYYKQKFVDFPFSPLNLMKSLGLSRFSKAGLKLLSGRLKKKAVNQSFESYALHTYGKTIAKYFLLNYSEKLWGRPCNELSSAIAGKRMKGLTFRTFLIEAIFGQKSKTKHLEGLFYYPKTGIGAISEKLGEFCGKENIVKNANITKILYNHGRIKAIEINGKNRIETDEVVSTLPLKLFVRMMEPRPSGEILLLAESLDFRNVILVVILLNRESVTKNATVYFPDSEFPFTRIYEPKNRSMYMTPPGKTSLVAEIPCGQDDELWNLSDDKLIQLVYSHLIRIGSIKENEIIRAFVRRMSYAYPMLEIGFEKNLKRINAYLNRFDNLKLSGRCGKFIYAHIHDMMKFGKEIIEEYISR